MKKTEDFINEQEILREKRNKKIEKLLWLDLEMTGLDIEKDKIVEVAAIATDMDFNELGKIDIIIKHSQKTLKEMSDWCKVTFTENKLLSKIIKSEIKEKDAEEKLLKFLDKHFKDDDHIIIVGNSIYNDRKFIDKYFKKVSKRLHYRMLDVSSFKILFKNKYLVSMNRDKESSHLAIEDVRESIKELRFYSQYIKVDIADQNYNV